MYIEDDIRNLLLDSTLDGTLSVRVDDFILNTAEGPVSLAATLKFNPDGEDFLLEVRDSDGRDLRSFFTEKTRVKEEDALSASGVLGNRLRVEFRKIWPPCKSTTRPIGDVNASSAIVEPEVIVIPPSTSDSQTHDEIRDMLNSINPHLPPVIPDEESDAKMPSFEHIAIFANTKLKFFNKGVKWTESHPFWGERSGSRGKTWDGAALGGTFSLKQASDHLEVGFRHDGDDDDEARLRFGALLQAVAYTHAIFPWPTFLQRRRNWRVMEQTLKVVRQEQGQIIPLREVDGHLSPSTPTDLIAAVAGLFHSLSPDNNAQLKQALWVFRGADSTIAPPPLQMAMICSVIEGLRAELFVQQEPPLAFTQLRGEALEWIKQLETASVDPERTGFIKRLNRRVEDWNYQDRRVEWNGAFGRHFPGRDKWVGDMFKLFNAHRHGPAHGNYGTIANGDPHAAIDALGRLAGFVNIIIAAKAGYRGPILESPYADKRIEVGAGV
jgi:hypothetical protein